MRKRTFIALLVFTMLGLFSRWLVKQQSPEMAGATASQRSNIDYDLENFVIREFDKKGHLIYSLTAPRMSRNASTGDAVITKPELFWPQKKDSNKTNLVADTGLISNDQNKIKLRGNVIIKSKNPAKQTTILRSEALDFDQSTRLVTSDLEVQVSTPGFELNSLGISANLDKNTVSMNQQVQGHYETE